ncbi:MAG TPA: hypothetical protein VGD99_19595, partial [Anaerolineae bacterium]
GEDAIFNITVENTGDVDLTDIDVDDAQCDSLIQDNDGNGDAVLDVGESWTYTCTVDDVSAGFTNSATATGTPPIGDDVSDTDTADVTVINPAIEVQKTPASQTIVSGEDAIFNITVENTGDVDLTDIDVDDAQCDSLIQDDDGNGDAVLDVGESWTYTCTVDDVSADFTNSATATGTPPIGDDVSDTDTADVTVLIPDSYYNIMATAGMHGSITPSGLVTVLEGDDRSFSITPDTGYQVADVLIDGVSAGAVLSYTFDIVQANHTIEAFFEEIPSAEYNAMIFLPLIMK